jgi:hypothetical protein
VRARPEILRVLEGTVRRGVIDDKDLQFQVSIGDGEDTLDATHEGMLLVVSRDNHGELWHVDLKLKLESISICQIVDT